MNSSEPLWSTPIHIKHTEDMPWPTEDKMFYLLTGEGLFVCRNHPFFRSCVPLSGWPRDLAGQETFLQVRYPRVPQVLFERIIGFFSLIGRRHGAEAAVLLLWDTAARQIRVLVPDQCSAVSRSSTGSVWPVDVRYEIPPLPSHLLVIGDMHSHVDGPAYASFTDQRDEEFRPGLHIVVGRIREEPPELHMEVTVDGKRFQVKNQRAFLEGYQRRREDEVPRTWLDKVILDVWNSSVGTISSDKTMGLLPSPTPSFAKRNPELLIDPDPNQDSAAMDTIRVSKPPGNGGASADESENAGREES